MAAVTLGVLGGTFDPVHIGHLVLAERAMEQLGLEGVLWVPAGDPWRKASTAISAREHRLAMVRSAVSGEAGFEVSTLEVDRAGPSFTATTLEALRVERPGVNLCLVLGVDALTDVPNWHDAARVTELATLGVAAREGHVLTADELERLLPGLSKRTRWFEMPRLEISATDLRGRAARGAGLRHLVPASVETYIREHKLYRPN